MSEDRARAREPEEDRAGRAAAAADVEAHRTKSRNKLANDEGDDVEAHRVIPRAKT